LKSSEPKLQSLHDAGAIVIEKARNLVEIFLLLRS